MDDYIIIAEVIRTEEYQSDPQLWRIEYKYRPGPSEIERSNAYLMPKTLTPPRVGETIELNVSSDD